MSRRASFPLIAGLLVVALGCGSKQDREFETARDSYAEAMQAIEQGDMAKAISALTASLATMPSVTVYMERAKLYAADGKQEEALQDCRAALELKPENQDAKWLFEEFEKPVDERFKGGRQNPPSSSK
jgi:Tfp pilus assembly protein PilF